MLHTELGSPLKRYQRMNQAQTRPAHRGSGRNPHYGSNYKQALWDAQHTLVTVCSSTAGCGRGIIAYPWESMLKVCRWAADLRDNINPATWSVIEHHDASTCHRVEAKIAFQSNWQPIQTQNSCQLDFDDGGMRLSKFLWSSKHFENTSLIWRFQRKIQFIFLWSEFHKFRWPISLRSQLTSTFWHQEHIANLPGKNDAL